MKNKEKYAKEIMDIACSGNRIAVTKEKGYIIPCNCVICSVCLFCGSIDCRKNIKDWLESEYVEKTVISKKDMEFLNYLIDYKYMARNKNGILHAYTTIPIKSSNWWGSAVDKSLERLDVCFPMVKWSDSEPWLIEDLKKLEVVEEY